MAVAAPPITTSPTGKQPLTPQQRLAALNPAQKAAFTAYVNGVSGQGTPPAPVNPGGAGAYTLPGSAEANYMIGQGDANFQYRQGMIQTNQGIKTENNTYTNYTLPQYQYAQGQARNQLAGDYIQRGVFGRAGRGQGSGIYGSAVENYWIQRAQGRSNIDLAHSNALAQYAQQQRGLAANRTQTLDDLALRHAATLGQGASGYVARG